MSRTPIRVEPFRNGTQSGYRIIVGENAPYEARIPKSSAPFIRDFVDNHRDGPVRRAVVYFSCKPKGIHEI